MTRADLKELHPHDIPLWLAVETAVWRLALAAKLPLRSVIPVPKRLLSVAAGYCSKHPHNQIQISLRHGWEQKAGFGKRCQLHFLLDTIAHEVAHLAAGWAADHGPQFFREFARMITLSEDINIRVDILAAQANLAP